MLTLAEMQNILDKIEFRGWTLTAFDHHREGRAVHIRATEPDNFGNDEPLELRINCFLSPNDYADEGSLLTWVQYRIGRAWTHEMDEQLRYLGDLLHHPHAEGADQLGLPDETYA